MIDFFHNHLPDPVLLSFGPVNIYWYGLFIVTGIIAAILVSFKLAGRYGLNKERIIDMAFWAVIAGIVGARLYHVLVEAGFYSQNPLMALKIWEGGLAIHGAVIGGLSVVYFYARKMQVNFWLLISVFAPGMALAQAIGRWGNYFNQELFGRPTELPWGIPISPANRILEHYNASHFHPAFLYESLGNLLIFSVLLYWHLGGREKRHDFIAWSYFAMYSALRFFMEFIRIDPAPEFLGFRLAQIVSLAILAVSAFYIYRTKKKPLQKTG
jgi:phosphatidylglycerol---prolipoprotein diacylglyceryl transferase